MLTQAFGLDGIQYMIIRGVVPEIMRQSNDILAAMTGGRMAVDIRTEREQKSTKTVVNSLEVWINTITGGNRPYQSHSGGEKVKIALAVTLGLADVKARRAGVQLGMLFIDEPPFLDADGTEAVSYTHLQILGYSKSKSYKVIKSLNRELENQGKCTCDGRVIKRYFHERYGLDELNASARRGA